jgi:DNA-binding transcriptional LysR family regulator
MDRLTELATLVAVVDHGGFSPAARALGRSGPTVTRIVANLEERLGVRLLDRTSRRCAPTEAGRRLAEEARGLLANYEQAAAQASGDAVSPRGPLRITAPYFFGREYVSPLVLDFVRAHDGVSAELNLSDRVADVRAENLHLAVRIGQVADRSLIARRLGSVLRLVVASPSYLEAFGCPKQPKDLKEHNLMQHGSRADRPWCFRGASGEELVLPVRAKFSVDQADAALAAARAGYGLIDALSYQVHADLVAGTLVRVLKDYEPEPLSVQLVWVEGRERLLRVRMMIDHLVAELKALPVLH